MHPMRIRSNVPLYGMLIAHMSDGLCKRRLFIVSIYVYNVRFSMGHNLKVTFFAKDATNILNRSMHVCAAVCDCK